ncbi:MAG: LLM class F420-dependent oxidoreductase [Myxococcota bacterium]
MKLGLYGINVGICADPETTIAVAQAAEDAGFESVWTAEHVVLPDPQVPPSPSAPDNPLLDPIVALSFVAAQTETLRLGTGIIILPQRNPVILAKELASLDVLSQGRLIFGLGVGYLRPEFDALGIPFADRGARTTEYLEAIRALWTQPKPEYKGRFVHFSGIQAQPRPIQKPHPPILMGASTPPALRRTVERGNGWYGFALDLAAAADRIAALRELEKSCDRPSELGPLEISITPPGRIDADAMRRYADLGVDRLIPLGMRRSRDALLELVEDLSEARERSS